MKRILILATLLAATGLSAPAAALPKLSENSYVTDRLIAARVADRIRKTCPEISARIIYAFSQARALKRWAEDQGYSESEIEGFLDDRAEKNKIDEVAQAKAQIAKAEADLKDNGATDEAGFCALGRAEIAKRSIIGSLIYEN